MPPLTPYVLHIFIVQLITPAVTVQSVPNITQAVAITSVWIELLQKESYILKPLLEQIKPSMCR